MYCIRFIFASGLCAALKVVLESSLLRLVLTGKTYTHTHILLFERLINILWKIIIALWAAYFASLTACLLDLIVEYQLNLQFVLIVYFFYSTDAQNLIIESVIKSV